MTGTRAGARARVGELVALYGLRPSQSAQLDAILRALADDAHAPSTVRDPALAVDVHLADSLVALDVEAVRAAKRLVDIGSGAGFPGLPLAVALAPSGVVLIEASRRKCGFLRHAIRAAGIANAEVEASRVEEWAAGAGSCDVALARALGPVPTVLEYAAPLLRVGGMLVDWRAGRDGDAGGGAASELGLTPAGVREVHPFKGCDGRYLHLYLKVRDTPKRFPRRPGMAAKRPLAALPAPSRRARARTNGACGRQASDRRAR